MTERKLDKYGRITIPKSIFRKLNFSEWQDIEITVEYGKLCFTAYKEEGLEHRPYVGIVRCIDTMHRVVIPVEYLKILEMDKKSYYVMEISSEDENKVIISKKEI